MHIAMLWRLLKFLVTTHSPQVLTTVRKEQIRLLSEDGTVEELPADVGTFGAESSRVLEEIFATHTRPPDAPTVGELRECLTLVELQQQDEDRGRGLRAKLKEALGSSDPDLLAADARISQLNGQLQSFTTLSGTILGQQGN